MKPEIVLPKSKERLGQELPEAGMAQPTPEQPDEESPSFIVRLKAHSKRRILTKYFSINMRTAQPHVTGRLPLSCSEHHPRRVCQAKT